MNIVTLHHEEECQLHKFWEIESYGTERDQDSKTKELLDVVGRYQESSIMYRENQYFVKLPRKSDNEELPTNEQVARMRTANVIKRLSKDPEMFRMYSDIIQDQERRGFIERVPDSELQETGNQVHYIPHHPVKKKSSTTPIRIVYDCSCHQNSDSPSLNDCLSSSPPILNKVTDLLVRFRCETYGIVTDIEKAPSDPSSEMTIYWFKAVLFGATCSRSHLLYRRTISPQDALFGEDNAQHSIDSVEANRQFQRKLTLVEHFSKRWRLEYLTALRERHCVAGESSTPVKVGSVVQISDNHPRPTWKLGVITEVITGLDGHIRAAKLPTSNGLVTTRPIVKLIPLELWTCYSMDCRCCN